VLTGNLATISGEEPRTVSTPPPALLTVTPGTLSRSRSCTASGVRTRIRLPCALRVNSPMPRSAISRPRPTTMT
jgi:hypothetical protein